MRKSGFTAAEKASENSDFHSQHLGAAIMYGSKVLAVGWNTEKTHSVQGEYNKYRGFDVDTNANKLHAEMMALNKVQNLDVDFGKLEIYVWRGKGKPQLSRPCKACEERIKAMGIKTVHYTGNNSLCTERYL